MCCADGACPVSRAIREYVGVHHVQLSLTGFLELLPVDEARARALTTRSQKHIHAYIWRTVGRSVGSVRCTENSGQTNRHGADISGWVARAEVYIYKRICSVSAAGAAAADTTDAAGLRIPKLGFA